ncbi:ketopantoate reductase family protein [Acidocella sp. KAb 2-4]|uniref:ketopantoate reductase family protein n=1 Tax=Acidocella sp. KAb 2-4 TaxID=2885158 RepID=UPI001D090023|nr:ketopantoate reductase family protein [Acidocella sp. KAb 2-4]MCB5943376.1 ketopantoate reductase family protein [Acidocella sp. KAb 2-4]
MRNIYLCGLGALGTIYVRHLAPLGLRVVADAVRIARYRAEGVRVNGEALALNYLAPGETAPPADLIIVAVKGQQLPEAVELLRPYVGPETVILSVMNGISSEEILGAAFGPEKLLYAFAVQVDAVRTGHEVRFSLPGTTVFGEARNAAISPRVAAVQALFAKAGLKTRVPEDMLRELWWKFMLNVGINQLSAVLRAPYGIFHGSDELRELVRLACREVVAVAQRKGIDLREDDIEKIFPIIGTLGPEQKTSMLQDVEAGRPTEVELFGGTVMALGRELDVATPVNEVLTRMIRVIDERL